MTSFRARFLHNILKNFFVGNREFLKTLPRQEPLIKNSEYLTNFSKGAQTLPAKTVSL